jgi:hypothetical protein
MADTQSVRATRTAIDELKTILAQGESARWIAGDKINSIVSTMDVSIRELESELPYKKSHIAELAKVADTFPPQHRVADEPFWRHAEVLRAMRKVVQGCRKHALPVPILNAPEIMQNIHAMKLQGEKKIVEAIASDYQPKLLAKLREPKQQPKPIVPVDAENIVSKGENKLWMRDHINDPQQPMIFVVAKTEAQAKSFAGSGRGAKHFMARFVEIGAANMKPGLYRLTPCSDEKKS